MNRCDRKMLSYGSVGSYTSVGSGIAFKVHQRKNPE